MEISNFFRGNRVSIKTPKVIAKIVGPEGEFQIIEDCKPRTTEATPIDVMIVAYADPMGFAAFNEVKEKLIFNIMKIVKSNKSEFAYPSTSLYVESMPK